ncbi:MAG: hypothetical protein WD009_13330 [Phycisphaeraceae bacterium]
MNRTTLAGHALTASAFLLAGLLVLQLAQHGSLETPAHASMVIAQPGYTVMTARTRVDEDSFFALDNRHGTLVIYRLSARGELQPATVIDLARVFGDLDAPPQ